jgi:hypothetical protein
MNMHRNFLLASKAMTRRALCAAPFIADARPFIDRWPSIGRRDHGVALPEAGDSIA